MATLPELHAIRSELRHRLEEATANAQFQQQKYEEALRLIYNDPDGVGERIDNQIRNSGADKAIELLEKRTSWLTYGSRRGKSPDNFRAPKNYAREKRAAKLALPRIIREREYWKDEEFHRGRQLARVEKKIRKTEKIIEKDTLTDRVISTVLYGRKPKSPDGLTREQRKELEKFQAEEEQRKVKSEERER